jgi:cytidylate kinase
MYYKRFFKVDPLTPHQYHLIINREFMDIDTSAEVVVTAARKLSESVVEGAASPS